MTGANSDHEHGPRVFIHQTAGHDAQEARVPAGIGQHQGRQMHEWLGHDASFLKDSPLEQLSVVVLMLQIISQDGGSLR